jgi:uncharacterized protein YkwD
MEECCPVRVTVIASLLLVGAMTAGVGAAAPESLAEASPARGSVATGRAASGAVATTMRAHRWEAKVLALTNARRKAHGVGPLKAARCPHRFAGSWARHMARTGDLVHHSSLSPLLRCGRAHAAGENIAEGYETPRAVVRAWMSDKGHRDNILDPAYTRIGIAGARRGHGPTFAIQDFVG